MSFKLGMLIDPFHTLNPKKDSSLAIMQAAYEKKWSVYCFELSDLYQYTGQSLRAKVRCVSINNSLEYSLGSIEDIELHSLDVVMMRKDPPVTTHYLHACHLLYQAMENTDLLVINHPEALCTLNEKLFATWFAHLMAPTLVASHKSTLIDFIQLHDEVVLKPLDGMGGQHIFKTHKNDPNLNVILDTLLQDPLFPNSLQAVMVQQFIPLIYEGDKRILMVGGQPIPQVLARIPAQGEFRGNLAAGGTGRAQLISEQELKIATEVGQVLLKKGISFAGIDVVGGYLTEINITSPTCIREIDHQTGTNIAQQLIILIESMLR